MCVLLMVVALWVAPPRAVAPIHPISDPGSVILHHLLLQHLVLCMYGLAGAVVLPAKHSTVVARRQHLHHLHHLPPLVPRGIGTNPFGCARLMPCHQPVSHASDQQHASQRQRYAPMMLVSAVRSWAGAPLCLSRQPAPEPPLASFTASQPAHAQRRRLQNKPRPARLSGAAKPV